MSATTESIANAPGSGEVVTVPRQTFILPLTRGYSAVIGIEDFERVSALRWCTNLCGSRPYAFRVDGTRPVYLHRWLLGVTDPKVHVDHVNRDTLDYRRSNLRAATASQNNVNRIAKGNRLGFLGVHARRDGLYHGRVKAETREHYTRSYATPLLAAIARDSLAKRLQGEFAVLNFPESLPLYRGELTA
jgi:hypothetical protein